MKGYDVNELLELAATGNRALFTQRLEQIVGQTVDEQVKPCNRRSYSGAVRPTSLIKQAVASRTAAACIYELSPEANPTKVMAQVASEIKRADQNGGVVHTEVVYAYAARTGIPFKALRVTYSIKA